MNWLLIVIVLILIWRIYEGVQNGMVKEIISFVSLVVLCLTVGLVGTALDKYFDRDIISMIVAILLLLVLCIVHKLLGIVFFSAKIIAKLPVIHSCDKLLGAVFGFLETLVLVWMIYSVIMVLDTGMLGEVVRQYAADSQILSFLYKYNYLQHFIEEIAAMMNL